MEKRKEEKGRRSVELRAKMEKEGRSGFCAAEGSNLVRGDVHPSTPLHLNTERWPSRRLHGTPWRSTARLVAGISTAWSPLLRNRGLPATVARLSYREDQEEVGKIHFLREELGGRTGGSGFYDRHDHPVDSSSSALEAAAFLAFFRLLRSLSCSRARFRSSFDRPGLLR